MCFTTHEARHFIYFIACCVLLALHMPSDLERNGVYEVYLRLPQAPILATYPSHPRPDPPPLLLLHRYAPSKSQHPTQSSQLPASTPLPASPPCPRPRPPLARVPVRGDAGVCELLLFLGGDGTRAVGLVLVSASTSISACEMALLSFSRSSVMRWSVEDDGLMFVLCLGCEAVSTGILRKFRRGVEGALGVAIG